MYKLKRKQLIVFTTVIVIIVGIIYYIYMNNNNVNITKDEDILIKSDENDNLENKISEEKIEDKIYIHVSGAVKNEGVIEINSNDRVKDAIDKAGGLKENADISNLNLASLLEDGTKVYIPTIEENKENENNDAKAVSAKEEPIGKSTTEQKSKQNIVNINTASQTELEGLPGIGPSTALKIINYRKENGKFSSIEDIKKVNGIGESKYNSIKDLIKVK